jgi:hypothetical protein
VTGELDEPGLQGFQAEVAEIALRAIAGQGFALAGAGALVAHGLITRATEDLDLFSPTEGGPGQVSASLQSALTEAGCQVDVLEAAERHSGEFLRLRVHRGEHVVDIDVARDWRQHPPVRMPIGPVLHVDDAVASKVTAMIGRGLPRDYIDVAAALSRYDRSELLRLAFHRDPGLRVIDVAHSMQLLDRLPDAPFADYGLTDDDILQVRRSLQDWPRDPEQEEAGRTVHAQAQQDGRSAASLAADAFPTPLRGALTKGQAVSEVASRSPDPAHAEEKTDNRGSYRRGN